VSNNRIEIFDSELNNQLWPPCRVACPVHADIQGYVGLIAQGKTKEALEVIRGTVLFAAVCGRICAHPCEDACRRANVDEAVSICSLKRFAADCSYPDLELLKPMATIDKKVAIIGAGPSGLTAAYDLLRIGYKVTAFEKMPEPGGMLRYGVPRYRLPTDVLMQDINPIIRSGLELKTDVEVGKDVDFNSLEEEGFEAILISAGLPVSRPLNIPGSDLEGIIPVIPFLQDVNSGKQVGISKKVIVIGGGDVAMDAARTAIRLGAEQVNMACLECGDEIPAHSWELEQTLEEGATLNSAKGPKRFLGVDGKVTGVEFMEVKSVFDDKGRFCPSFYEDKLCVIEGDTVILAIGQASDLTFLEGTDVELIDGRRLVWDSKNLSTSRIGVFASGEVVTGPGAAIAAIASGHNAAVAIDIYLREGKVAPVRLPVGIEVSELREETIKKIKKIEKEEMPMVSSGERIANFDEFELGFGQDQAAREAQRCLSCTMGAEVIKEKCAACLTCVRVCPFGVPYIKDGEFAGIDVSQCQSCGICPSECPAKAIKLKFASEDEVLEQAKEALATAARQGQTAPILSVTCQHGYYVSEEIREQIAGEKELIQIKVLCTGRIGIDTLLKFFEMGTAGVIIVTCEEEDCRFNKGNQRILQRAIFVKDLLEQIGLPKECLQLCNISSTGGEDRSFREAVDKIKESLDLS